MSAAGEVPVGETHPGSSKETKADDASTDKLDAPMDIDIGASDSEKTMREASEQHQEEIPESAKRKALQAVPETEALKSGDIASYKNPSKTPECSVLSSHSTSEGSSPFIREKVIEDGYNWRKYGQKLVKGNEFTRSYYRCTHTNCTAKKQLERSPGGQIVKTVHFGQHCHPKPLGNFSVADAIVPINEHKPNVLSAAGSKEKSSGSRVLIPQRTEPTTHRGLPVSVVSSGDDVKAALLVSSRMKGETHSNDSPGSKRRKKDGGNGERSPADRSTKEPRTVVHTQTMFDIANDGYRWRKYGQKSVKGSPFPRSYYRCSSSGCPAKKHVERSSQDAKVLIATYEGKHDHDIPPGRIITSNILDLEVDKTHKGGLSSKGGDASKTQHSSALQIITKDQVEDGSRTNPERSSSNGLNRGLISDVKPNEQTKDSSDQNKGDQAANLAKSGTKSGEKTTVCHENTVSKSRVQKLKSEPVQS